MNSMRENLEAKVQQESSLMIVQGGNSIDRKFLKKLQTVLGNNLANTSFSAEDLAKSMHMSRMQLHRKLKVLTGDSYTILMRQHRLREAARLLVASDLYVAQIAYNVGFSSPSYFSKCFREKYGVTPVEYVKIMKG